MVSKNPPGVQGFGYWPIDYTRQPSIPCKVEKTGKWRLGDHWTVQVLVHGHRLLEEKISWHEDCNKAVWKLARWCHVTKRTNLGRNNHTLQWFVSAVQYDLQHNKLVADNIMNSVWWVTLVQNATDLLDMACMVSSICLKGFTAKNKWSLSSASSPQILHVGLTLNWLNFARFGCKTYVPVKVTLPWQPLFQFHLGYLLKCSIQDWLDLRQFPNYQNWDTWETVWVRHINLWLLDSTKHLQRWTLYSSRYLSVVDSQEARRGGGALTYGSDEYVRTRPPKVGVFRWQTK